MVAAFVRRSLPAAATALALGVVLVGCSRPVRVDPPQPEPTGPALQACTTFQAALPASLSTVGDRREVTPGGATTAAFGDPPVGVRCGVPEPAGIPESSTLVTVDGIDWYPEQLSAGWRLTSVGRVAAVELTVPAEQGPAPSVAADLAATIHATIPPAG